MQSIFKKVLLASAIAATAALATIPALASTTVNVPFSFKVAGKILPAGSYRVERDLTGSFVTLKGAKSSQSFCWILNPGPAEPANHKIALKFEDRDRIHVLKSIQFGSMVTPNLDKAKSNDNDSERVSQSW